MASEDRFVRLKYYIDYAPKPKSEAMAIAIIKSLIASTNVPFGAPVSCHRRIAIFLPLLRLSQPLLSLSDSIKAGFTRHGGRALLIAPISESRNTAECVRSCLRCANSFSLHHQGLLFGWLKTPNIIWTDISKINEIGAFEEGQPNLRLKPQDSKLVGDVVCEFKTADGKAPVCSGSWQGKEER